MELARLHEILTLTTAVIAKGDIKGDEAEKADPNIMLYDLCFVHVAVDMIVANEIKAELVSILNDFPPEANLHGGPSYILIGGIIGDQGAAFQLFALGTALGLWSLITPRLMLGNAATKVMIDRLAGSGFIMISGYTKQ